MTNPFEGDDAAFDTWLEQSNQHLIDATGQALDLDERLAHVKRHSTVNDTGTDDSDRQDHHVIDPVRVRRVRRRRPLPSPITSDPDPQVPDVHATNERPTTSLSTDGYRGPAACQIAGITYRQLDYWARTGLVSPSVRGGAGSGSPRLYSVKDILFLKIVKRLLDTGVPLQVIRSAIEHLRNRSVSDLEDLTLFSDGTTVYECTSPEEIAELVQGRHDLFGITVKGHMREINGTIDEFPAEQELTDSSGEEINLRASRVAGHHAFGDR